MADTITVAMLTTIDNPFDPFDQFDLWYQWDEQAGYHSCSYLSRVAYSSNELSEVDTEQAIQDAINEIVTINPFGVHRKVTRERPVEDLSRFIDDQPQRK